GRDESSEETGLWWNGSQTSSTVKDRKGNGLNQNTQQLSDNNGNFLQRVTGPPYAYADTLARNRYAASSTGDTSICRGPLQVTGATIYSYPGYGATSRQIQVCTALVTLNTHFAAVSPYGPIREITNNQQSWSQSII